MTGGRPRAPHGTSARYTSHRRDREEPCDACRAANAARLAARRKRTVERRARQRRNSDIECAYGRFGGVECADDGPRDPLLNHICAAHAAMVHAFLEAEPA
jgi:hypothetical protein